MFNGKWKMISIFLVLWVRGSEEYSDCNCTLEALGRKSHGAPLTDFHCHYIPHNHINKTIQRANDTIICSILYEGKLQLFSYEFLK